MKFNEKSFLCCCCYSKQFQIITFLPESGLRFGCEKTGITAHFVENHFFEIPKDDWGNIWTITWPNIRGKNGKKYWMMILKFKAIFYAMIIEINNFDLIWFNPFFNKLSFLRSDPPLKKTISEIAKIPGWGIEGSEQSIPLRLNKKQKNRKKSFLLLQINGHTSLEHWGQIYGKGFQLSTLIYSNKFIIQPKFLF